MITKLEIINFKGVENAVYDELGLVNSIYGKNAAGKTSILDCILWLISGATLTYGDSNKVDDKCINTKKPNKIINAKITIDDETFERKFGHIISKEDDSKLTDVNYFYHNDRLCKNQKEYYDAISSVLGIDKISTKEKINVAYALMNPYVFGKEMKEETFRRFIMSIINVDFNNMIMEKSDKYDELKNDFKKQGCDINNLITYINQQIKKEKSTLVDFANTIDIELDEDEKSTNDEINELIEEKARLTIGFNFAPSESTKQLIEERKKLENEIKLSEQDDMAKNVSKEEIELSEIVKKQRNDYNDKVDIYTSLSKNLEMLKSKSYSQNMKIVSLRERKLYIEKQSIEETICPHCGKIVNEKQLEELKVKIKSETLDIDNELSNLEKISKELNADIEKKQKELDDLTENLKFLKQEYSDNKLKLQELQNDKNKIVISDKTKELKEKYDSLSDEIESLIAKETKEYEEKVKENQQKSIEIGTQINTLREKLNKIIQNNVLKKQKKEHLQTKATLEYKLSLCKDFANELSNITNKYSKEIFGDDVEFVMLKKLKTTDEYKPVCYAQIKGVPYDSLNTANCLLTGIIIIEKIKKYVGTKDIPVVFDIIDNIGESSYKEILSKCHSQIFFTEVDKSDKEDRQIKVLNNN